MEFLSSLTSLFTCYFSKRAIILFFFFKDKIQMGLTLTSGMQRDCQRNYCESGIRSSPRDDLPGRRQHQHTRWLWGQSREVVPCVLNSTVRALWLSPLKEATSKKRLCLLLCCNHQGPSDGMLFNLRALPGIRRGIKWFFLQIRMTGKST